ncbi:acetate kinase [Clostridium sp.]|uniref:acetate/propionate family kinase n=1 Tax=Clostridium sp. TaxID=1506 RepID=UPI002A90B837|nr:acetate kinase [Clostridium sp.]MDY6012767.1 acetate kinase [Clostridium sp.]
MKVLVINCGSSSLKYRLIDMAKEECIAKGLVERIGLKDSVLTQKSKVKHEYKISEEVKDHQEAIKLVLKALVDKDSGVISSMEEIGAVGHRVVHGGERYENSVIIDDDVLSYLEKCSKLAPLHNPSNIIGIRACQEIMKGVPMVAVFDTAFHQTMPEVAYIYPIEYKLYEDYRIRKYGFHGTSHKYVSNKLGEILGKDIKDLKIISCHLGNGASITAIKDGKSFDTTMGFTPLEGIVMGTRSGSIDPAIPTYLMKECNYTLEEVETSLNKKSGVLGISGVSSDFRDIEKAVAEGNERAKLALDIFHYKIKGQIGAYIAQMGGVDAIIFTAGVGENGPESREACLSGLEFLGIKLDSEKNKSRGKLTEISAKDSKVKVYVIPTNEELMIAKETVNLLK